MAEVTFEHVIWAYRIFVEREPESFETIKWHAENNGSVAELRERFLSSPEYLSKNGVSGMSRQGANGQIASLRHEFENNPHWLDCLEYQRQTFNRLFAMAALGTLKGLKIMDVGENGNLAIAKSMAAMSGNSVTIANPAADEIDIKYVDGNIIYLPRKLEELEIAPATLDIIYGCAVLEHIADINSFLNSCWQFLKTGGHLLLQGGPMWNSNLGHHLYIKTSEYNCTFGENNIIPPWGHLLYDQRQLCNLLIRNSQPEKLAKLATAQIYNSNQISRCTSWEITEALEEEKWETSIEKDYVEVPENLKDKIREGVNNLYICAKKKKK